MADLKVTPAGQVGSAAKVAAETGKKAAAVTDPAKVSVFEASKEAKAGKEAAQAAEKAVDDIKTGKKGFFEQLLDKLKNIKKRVVIKFKKSKAGKAAQKAAEKVKDSKVGNAAKKAGESIKKAGSKLTKTKAGKTGLIATGVGLILAGIGYAISKLFGGDDDQKADKAETKPADKADKTNPEDKTKPEDKTNPEDKTKPEDGTDPKPAVPVDPEQETPEEKDDGEEVEVTIEPEPEEIIKGKHKVVKGESIDKMVRDALKEQGVEKPTEEQLKAAKRLFVEMNKDIVKIYHGIKKEWHGNKFFYPDDEVKIPDFNAAKAEE